MPIQIRGAREHNLKDINITFGDGLTVVTGGVKNSYGILPGAQKAMLHRLAGTPMRFHELIVDVFQLRPPDLFIVDAVVGMEGNGPASPELREMGLILASDNAVALDATISRLMGVEPGRLRFLQRAKEAGLGDFDESLWEVMLSMRDTDAPSALWLDLDSGRLS